MRSEGNQGGLKRRIDFKGRSRETLNLRDSGRISPRAAPRQGLFVFSLQQVSSKEGCWSVPEKILGCGPQKRNEYNGFTDSLT
jgi:hypothetical protein